MLCEEKFLILLASLLMISSWKSLHIQAKEKNKDDVGHVIGIDFGTTYSCVGVYNNGRVEILANDQGNRMTPSMVAFTADGERLVGEAAKNQLVSNPERTITNVKSFIGKQFDDPSMRSDLRDLPYSMVNEQDKPHYKVKTNKGKEETYSPVQIASMILSKMKKIAEQYLDKKVNHAVVTVPAYFNEAQRQAIKEAGALAELNVGLINESTAAAIAYGLHKNQTKTPSSTAQGKDTQNIIVYHLGGATFDVSIMKIKEGTQQVMATNGDLHLGGESFNRKLTDHLIELYQNKTGHDVRKDQRATLRLRREVEKAKKLLSSAYNARVEVDPFFDGDTFNQTVSRVKFNELNTKLFRSTLDIMSSALKNAKLDRNQIDQVILVGGSTRVPMIKRIITDYFDDRLILQAIQPDEVVAYGAAIQANEMTMSRTDKN